MCDVKLIYLVKPSFPEPVVINHVNTAYILIAKHMICNCSLAIGQEEYSLVFR